MLAQRNRFHRRNHVKYVYSKGKSVRADAMTLKYLTGQKHAEYRAGVVVSKKVSKSAVKRNRIRRRIYEVIRTTPNIRNDSDLLITVFSDELMTMPSNELTKLTQELLKKAQIVE